MYGEKDSRYLPLYVSLFFIYAIFLRFARRFLSYDTLKTLIHAFVTARIKYCNSSLYGQPKCILRRLQSVLNGAARLIHLTSRHEHITSLLIRLHWLPIENRISFKIVVITKAKLILLNNPRDEVELIIQQY